MRYISIVIILSVLTQSVAFADESDWIDESEVKIDAPRRVSGAPTNVVFNNGPVGGADSILLPQLLLAQKDLQMERVKRAAMLDELNHAKEETHVGRTIFWTIIGIAAGAGGTYAITRHK